MPTPDDHADPTPRAARRALGRGPGTASPDPGVEPPAGPVVPAQQPPAAGREEPGGTGEGPAGADTGDAGEHVAGEPAAGPADGPGTSPAGKPPGELPGQRGEKTAEAPPAESDARPEPQDGPEPQERPEPEDGPGPAAPPGPAAVAEVQPGAPPEGGEAAPQDEEPPDDGRFKVVLDNFEGPFDLLLQLISKHKLDVTEVALSKVTDEFMAYIHAMGVDWDLDQTTEFLVVAATLLDLKAARLLPAAEVEDEADLALLEARDLLFARLLQYRAYKEIARIFAGRLAEESRRHPRTVGLEPHHAELLPEVVISIGPEGFARLAVKAMQPKPKPQVYVEHIHAPLVSVREQAEVMIARLRESGEATFQQLTEDAGDTLTVVARFLALLELYRERAVSLDQEEALGLLTVRWSGAAGAEPLVTDEFDQEAEPGTPEPAPEEEMQP